MRVLWVFRNKTPPIFFIPSVFIVYRYLDLYNRPYLLYSLFLQSAGICGYSQVLVDIEDDIIRNTPQFPHPIKIEGRYHCIFFSSVTYSGYRGCWRSVGKCGISRQILRLKIKNISSAYVASPYAALLSHLLHFSSIPDILYV